MVFNSKRCVFCGLEKPSKKTREHIIPRWLDKLTERGNVAASLHTPNGEISETWKNIVLPACKSCNEAYSALEADAKDALTEIMSGAISPERAEKMLLWLDKIRVGFWLLGLTRGKAGHGISPNFSISDRIGKSERLMRIFRVPTRGKGIGLIGTDNISWYIHPVCFALFVNDLIILNISTTGFLGGWTGSVRLRKGYLNIEGPQPLEVEAESTGFFDHNWQAKRFRFATPVIFRSAEYDAISPFSNQMLHVADSTGFKQMKETVPIPKIVGNIDRTMSLIQAEIAEIQYKLLDSYDLFFPSAKRVAQKHVAGRELRNLIEYHLRHADQQSILPIPRRVFS